MRSLWSLSCLCTTFWRSIYPPPWTMRQSCLRSSHQSSRRGLNRSCSKRCAKWPRLWSRTFRTSSRGRLKCRTLIGDLILRWALKVKKGWSSQCCMSRWSWIRIIRGRRTNKMWYLRSRRDNLRGWLTVLRLLINSFRDWLRRWEGRGLKNKSD